MTRSNAASASGVSRSPTCCERTTSLPKPRPTTFFRCAPTARTVGSVVATGTGSGAKPRARRRSWSSSPKSQPTLSSVCRSTGRSWTRKRSAMGPRRATASARPSRSARRRGCRSWRRAERRPRRGGGGGAASREHQPEARRLGGDVRGDQTVRGRAERGRRRIGASGERSQPLGRRRDLAEGACRRRRPSPSARAASRAAPFRRAGARRRPRSGRRSRGGSRRAPSPRRSARRGGPRPRRERLVALRKRLCRRGSRARGAGRTPGTRSAGRGSAGRAAPRTRGGSPAQSAKPRIVVFGRSYGSARTIVKRGPQFVQFRKG